LPAGSIVYSDGEVSREIVVAVAGLTDTVVAADDDVGLEGLASAEGAIESVGGTGENSGGRVATMC
jgi:hypothetical protein